jgi:gluconate 5-dehydrogenase
VPDSPFDLHGRRALVTGSTRGIGAEIAAGLARAGASVVLHGRDPENVESARRGLLAALAGGGQEAEGPRADVRGAAFDITDHTAMLAEVRRVEEELGGIDVLVNNAGMQWRGPLLDFPLAGWDQVIATNLTSCFVLAQEVARGMVQRGAGKVINVCSVQNKLVRATTAPYAVAKGGLGSLTQAMCAEWASLGIQANGLAPGYIATELNAPLLADAEFSAWVVGRTPARRWGTPSDLVGPAVWLASAASDFVNGQIIYVDGGLTAVL